jgi:ubiquinone/menaquinone biosynthesis C-methylase UbiE
MNPRTSTMTSPPQQAAQTAGQVLARLLPLLACPACHAQPLQAAQRPSLLACNACGARYAATEGIPDFAGATPPVRVLSSQWVMEFAPLVSIYENLWRPRVTKPFSDLDWELRTALDKLELAPASTVLDLACGTGNFTRAIAGRCPSGQVLGADLSLPMLRHGTRLLRDGAHANVTLMRVDVTRWPFAQQRFDRVHCAGALHLFPQLDRVLAAVYASLKPGGVFVCATYTVATHPLKRLVQQHVSRVHGFNWFDPGTLRGQLDTAGFTQWQAARKREGLVFSVRKPAHAVAQ